MKKFGNLGRICFLGDSITETGDWISYIYSAYRNYLPNEPVEVYNCGISGGTTGAALKYMKEDLLSFSPTHVVIMFGINDINRSLYLGQEQPDSAVKKQVALDIYRNNLIEICTYLKENNIAFSFCSPTPYKEEQTDTLEKQLGLNEALGQCREIIRELAKRYKVEYIDFFEKFHSFCMEQPIIGPDGIHPTLVGHEMMARHFLYSQVFKQVEDAGVYQSFISNLFHTPDEKEVTRRHYETILRAIWSVEWLLLRDCYELSDAKKVDKIKLYIQDHGVQDDYMGQIARIYIEHKMKQKQIHQKLLEQTKTMYPVAMENMDRDTSQSGDALKPYCNRIHFTVSVNQCFLESRLTNQFLQFEETNCDVWCALKLPKNYSENGTPVPLVLYAHGSGGFVTETEVYGGYELNTRILLQHGYAVFDVNGSNLENGSHGNLNMGSSRAVSAYTKAYQYIINNYNIDPRIFVHGTSMGGLSAYNFTLQNSAIVRAVSLSFPVTDLYHQAWLVPFSPNCRQKIAEEYNFEDTSGTQWEPDKVIGYNPIEANSITIEGKRHNSFPVPIFFIHGTSDTTVNYQGTVALYEALRASGCNASLHLMDGVGHSFVPAMYEEEVIFFNRYFNFEN